MKKVTADIFELHDMPIEEAKSFIDWAYLMKDKTQFKPEVLSHPRMCMTRASFDGKPGLYVPIRPVLMFDALTPDPALSNMERVIGMKRISDLVEHQVMPDTGMFDSFFYTNDDAEAETAAKHGWTEVKNVRLFQKRITAPKPADSKTEAAKETSDV